MQEIGVWSLVWEDLLEKEMATHSCILAWEIHGQRSLLGYSPWGHRVETTATKQQQPPLMKAWITSPGEPSACPEVAEGEGNSEWRVGRGRVWDELHQGHCISPWTCLWVSLGREAQGKLGGTSLEPVYKRCTATTLRRLPWVCECAACAWLWAPAAAAFWNPLLCLFFWLQHADAERGGSPRQTTLGRRGVALMVRDVLRTSHLPCRASLELLRSLSLPLSFSSSLPPLGLSQGHACTLSPDSPNLPYFPAHLAPASQRTGTNTSVSTTQSRMQPQRHLQAY